MAKIYNKLVRDKIPEIIKEDNHEPVVSILDCKKYKKELMKKLVEEANEVKNANNKEELVKEIGDVYEVIDAIVKVYKLDIKEIKKIKKDRKKIRGGFDKKIFLKKVH